MAASSSNRSTLRSAWIATHCGPGWAGCCKPKATRGSASPHARWLPPNCGSSIRCATPRSTSPINDFGWDALRDLGALIKSGSRHSPLEQSDVHRVYLGGYSQSAVDVATFAMAFNAMARLPDGSPIYDGYFPAAHAASFAAIASGNAWRPPMEHPAMRDIDVPVIEVQPQSDVEGFAAQIDSVMFVNPGSASVRRADSDFKRDRYRLYELAGAPHAARLDGCEGQDRAFRRRHSCGRRCDCCSSGPRTRCRRRGHRGSACKLTGRFRWRASTDTETRSAECDHPISTFRWRGMRRIHARGRCANSRVARRRCPSQTLVARYRDATRYLTEFTAALDATIRARYLLPADREPILRDVTAEAQKAFAAADYQEVLIP